MMEEPLLEVKFTQATSENPENKLRSDVLVKSI